MLFTGALIASLRSPRGIPIPTGMGKCMINISFCFCFCVCCSPQCRAKTLQVMVLLSFVYHSTMDAISIAFILFDEEYRTHSLCCICHIYLFFTLSYLSWKRETISQATQLFWRVLGDCVWCSDANGGHVYDHILLTQAMD